MYGLYLTVSLFQVYNGQTMSLNTGIVTTLNFQRDVAFAVSQLTLAHELGHNLGSPVSKGIRQYQ